MFKSEKTRAIVYRTSLAAVALAGVYSFVSDAQAVGWVGVITALFGNGLATINTSTK